MDKIIIHMIRKTRNIIIFSFIIDGMVKTYTHIYMGVAGGYQVRR